MRCRLSLLNNTALVYSPNAVVGGGKGFGVSANEYSCAHRAEINFGDLTPHLTNAENKIEVLTWQGWRLQSPIAS
jgi:hypothetical protein